MKFRKGKCNHFNLKMNLSASAYGICNGDSKITCGPCAIHRMLESRRVKGTVLLRDPLLFKPNGKPLSLGTFITFQHNIASRLGLKGRHYRFHSLHSGRATYLVRNNTQTLYIAKWGRWSNDCLEKLHTRIVSKSRIRSDMSSLAELTKTSC
eukprot:931060_1